MEENFFNLSQSLSQDQIYNFFGGIEIEKILAKKTYPVWAFTNENLEELKNLTHFRNKEIFSVLGSADQPVFFLSQGAKQVISSDSRSLACLYAEFKISLFKNLNFKEFKEIFFEKEKKNSKIYFEKIRNSLSSYAKKFYDYLFEGLPKNIFTTLKKSGFFYGESWYFLKKKNWLFYLKNQKEFLKAKKKINNLFILNSDLNTSLKKLKRKFDLIYTSNIFDSKKYCQDPEETIVLIDLHLQEKGEILITSQNFSKEVVFFLKKMGYNLKIKEPKKSFWQLFSPFYSYYYLLAKKK